jgi:hypothetical protein
VRGKQKGFDQVALAADDHAGQSFVPLPLRNIRLFIEPLCQRRPLAKDLVSASARPNSKTRRIDASQLSDNFRALDFVNSAI